ncbi:FAD-dependent oxidoreductase [Deltaproteobacteria bacterium TL4]
MKPSEPQSKDQDPTQTTRRGFLGMSATTVGIAAAVGGTGLAAIPLNDDPFYRAKYPKVDENHVDLKSNGKTVCILGGGLSGLQAGVELSSRGFKVTLLEKTGIPGGKLKSWRDKSFGPKDHPWKKDPNFQGFIREHGLHAIWGFYNNLREFMGRYGFQLQDASEKNSIYTFLDKDGTQSYIPKTTWPSPYDRVEQLTGLMKLDHLKGKESEALSFFLRLMTFDYADKKQREYMDSMTIEDYCKKLGLSDALTYKIVDSIVEMAYFNNVDKLSALTVGNIFELVAGSPKDWDVNFYMNPPGETFLQPMVNYILGKGGEIHYNTEVERLMVKNGQIAGILTSQINMPEVRRCQVCGELIYGNMHYEECPFCGAEGAKLKLLSEEEKTQKTFEADFYISAMDIPASQKLIAMNQNVLGGNKYFDNITNLHATEVYVLNMWFEGGQFWKDRFKERPDNYVFFATGFQHLGITINWTLPALEGNTRGIIKEYAGQDITIIETQISKAHLVQNFTNAEIAEKCHAELKTVMPDLPPYQSYYLNKWRHYTTYHPGDESLRPPIQSPFDNLLFIGDMAFVPHPAVFMEKTNVTAKWATNLLLDKIGQKEGKIKILMSGTPSNLIAGLKKVRPVTV